MNLCRLRVIICSASKRVLENKTMKNIKQCAEREMIRMTTVFEKLRVVDGSQAKHFYDVRNSKISEHPKNLARDFYGFASNYYKDGIYFFKKKQYIEAFEAFIIAWAYIDCGLKMRFFQVPKEQKEWFTA